MKSTILGKHPMPIKRSKFYFMCTLLLLAGCAHNPDIRTSGDNVDGITSKSDKAYIDCVKDEVQSYTSTYTVENGGKTDLFIGSTNPGTTDGLVEVSSANGHSLYTAYQRDAWYDKGRLLDAAQACSRG